MVSSALKPHVCNLVSASNLLPRLSVFLPRLLHNLIGHPDAFLPFQTLADQPIPQELLIETLLATTDLVGVLGPESRRVWG